MTNKPLIKLKKIINPYGKPYLFLIKQEDNKVQIISSYDKEFYKEFMRAKEEYDSDLIECSKKTKKLLKKDISWLLDNYRFDEERFEEGKDLYRYEHFLNIEEEIKDIKEKSLYDWSILGKKEYYKNIGDVYALTKDASKLFCSALQILNGRVKIAIRENLKYIIYHKVNAYITSLYLWEKDRNIIFAITKSNDKYSEDTGKYLKIIDKDFHPKVREVSRHLLLPYDEIIRLIENSGFNNFYELLDYIEDKIYGCYPRKEIKEHLLDCIFIKEYEEKHKEGVKTYEKNIFQRFRKLF